MSKYTWKPIKTAPKDKYIIGVSKFTVHGQSYHAHPTVITWDDELEDWCEVAFEGLDGFDEWATKKNVEYWTELPEFKEPE